MRITTLSLVRFKIALFAMFLVAPVLSLAMFGVVDLYGGPHPKFPSLTEVLKKRGKLDDFGNAVLHRSAAMKSAIRLRSWIAYRVVGAVDARRVVSGQGVWLFLRSEFSRKSCLNEDKTARSLAQLAAMTDLARAAGIDMIMAVSPDKSTLYPEFLSQAMRGYWRCQARDAALLRRALRDHAPRLVDHALPLLDAKARRPEAPLYFATDSHWTPYGAALALRQLLHAVIPGTEIPMPTVSGTMSLNPTDLTRILLLHASEEMPALDPAWEARLPRADHDRTRVRTVLIRDSFYNRLDPLMQATFQDLRILHHEAADADLDAAVMSADRLIVNSVERLLLSRIHDESLAWDGPIAQALIKRSRARAAGCRGFGVADAAADRSETSGGNGETFDVPAGSPDRLPCLRVTLLAPQPATLEIALPDGRGGQDSVRVIKVRLGRNEQVMTLVLPADVAGGRIMLRATPSEGAAHWADIEVGHIARPILVSDFR